MAKQSFKRIEQNRFMKERKFQVDMSPRKKQEGLIIINKKFKRLKDTVNNNRIIIHITLYIM